MKAVIVLACIIERIIGFVLIARIQEMKHNAKPRRAMDEFDAQRDEFDPSEWTSAVVAFEEEEEEEEEVVWYPSTIQETMKSYSEIPPWLKGAWEMNFGDMNLVLEMLSTREAQVIRHRFLSQDKPVQLQVANRMDISLARVSQLENQARTKLEKYLMRAGTMSPCYKRKRPRISIRRRIYPQARTSSLKRNKRWYEESKLSAIHGEEIPLISKSRPEAAQALLLRQLVNSVGYFYFKDDLCLEDQVLARVAARHGRVLSQRRETLRTKADALSSLLNLDDSQLRHLISAQPALLGYATSTLTTKFKYLNQAYPYANTTKAIMTAPSLLTASIQYSLYPARNALFTLFKEDDDNNTKSLKKVKEISRLFAAAPGLARQNDLYSIFSILSARLCTSNHSTRSIVRRVPILLTLSATKISNRFAHLDKICGSHTSAVKAVKRYPQVLTLSKKKIDFTIQKLGEWLDPSAIESVCTQCPSVLTRSHKHLDATFDFLSNELGLGPTRTAAVIRRRPQALSLSLEKNLKPITLWLRVRLFLDTPRLAQFIHSYPTVLGLSPTKNLGPKLDLLKTYARHDPIIIDTFASHDKDLALSRAVARLVTDCPAVLGYSRSRRIQPRLEALLSARHQQGIFSFLAISSYLTVSDATFRSKLGLPGQAALKNE
uniref:RNA polymerase sigma-70 region 4 domain-containing protein n=1 Tax=Aureoumbra lagunensis TaxID=44058 RepID=A0A7S3K0Z1_9STRA|mmetsp:Transcript_8934/g.13734  ORF Transcript_8934/g.13734 Transcript_8934/m.13734 type:complete len:661 (-) Transcript_8934:82-2064(-)